MNEIVTLIATLTAKPDQSELLGHMLSKMVAPSRAEEGCLTYNIHRSNTDPTAWIVYENWRSKKDLDDHMKLPPFLDFIKQAPNVLAKEIDFNFVTLTSPLED